MSELNKKKWTFLVVDPDRCTGCEICESVCSMTHYGEFNPKFSRIHRIRIEPILNNSIACIRCSEPDCISACDLNALIQDKETGTIHVDPEICNGCGACVRACSFGAITVHPENALAICCDLCETTEYDQPQCARYCPKSAIYLCEYNSDKEKDNHNRLVKIIQKGFPQPEDGVYNTMREEYREYT